MFHRKTTILLLITSASVCLTGCSPEKTPKIKKGYYHSGIYFGKNFSADYQQGIADGCSTAKGVYTKSRYLFNNRQDYNDGWFLGRNRCKHLLVIKEDEKIKD
jgi:hypothetical protein